METPKNCAIRAPFLMEKLLRHTAEEDEALQSGGPYRLPDFLYLDEQRTTIDGSSLLGPEGSVCIGRQPRFTHVPKHRHNFIEAVYQCSGRSVHRIEGKDIVLEAGDILLMNQYTSHECLPCGEEDVAVNLMLRTSFFDDTYELAAKRNVLSDFIVSLLRDEVNCNQYLHYKTIHHLPVSHLIEIMLTTYFPHDDDIAPRGAGGTYAMQDRTLMFMIFWYLSRDLSDLSVDGPMNFDEITKITVMNYIRENYQTATLTELAEIMNQSPSALSRQIKVITGSTFKELLQAVRFQRAVKLLEETNLAVSDIALAVGYENSSYFYRRFREINAISPKLYRELHQK